MSIIIEHGTSLLTLACLFGLFMAWGVGANDVANAMGTSVGSKALTLVQALIIAAIFEFLGAYLAGGSVTDTISKGIINSQIPLVHEHPELLIYGMISSLLATAGWLVIASKLGWPVSTTHSIIGAIIGFAAVGISPSVVHWSALSSVVGSWVITPVIAGSISYLVFSSIQKFILNSTQPFKMAQRYLPCYIFVLGFILAIITITSGLSHIGIFFNHSETYCIAIGTGLFVALVARFVLARMKEDRQADKQFAYSSVERLFGYMMIFTASSMAFAHGSNDVANAVGPLATVVAIIDTGTLSNHTILPQWVLLLGGTGIIIGLATYGYKVIATIGKNIMELTPSRGFSAEISAATTVILASGLGLPISTTQTLVGAVLGVGMARGISALNLRVIGTIFVSWVITLPAGAILSIIVFKILVLTFSW